MNIDGIGTGIERGETPALDRTPARSASGTIGDDVQRLLHPHDLGDFLHGLLALPGAAAQAASGLLGEGLAVAGQFLDERPGEAGHLADAGAQLRALGTRLGQAADHLGRALESLTHGKIDDFAGEATAAVTEGITDLRELGGVVEGITHHAGA
jgi:hypothetical protein